MLKVYYVYLLLGHIEGLNVRVIPRYIPTIIRNKTFLTTGPERFK